MIPLRPLPAVLAVVLLHASTVARAQDPEAPAQAAAATEQTQETEDAGSRLTPRGSMRGFFTAIDDSDFNRAAEYLDLRNLPRAMRNIPPERLAEMLGIVIERELWVDLDDLSADPDGKTGDELPPYRDELGRIGDDQAEYTLLLQRVPDGAGGQVWKVSNATIAILGDLYERFGYGPVTEAVAKALPNVSFLGVELFKWVVTLGVGLIAFPLASLLGLLLTRLISAPTSELYPRIKRLFLRPFPIILSLVAMHQTLIELGVGLTGRMITRTHTLTTIAVVWLLLLATTIIRDAYAARMRVRGREGALVLLGPATSVVRILIVLVAVLVWLDNAGFNITTLLAGLGVGGVAMALALQKPLEDVFGALTLYTQQPVRVGDFCRFGPETGTVEEIGLRTTRIRTLANSVISIPNHKLAAEPIDNYSLRRKFLYKPVLRLRVDTRPEQVEQVLAGVRQLLETDERLIQDSPRIRFQNIGLDALELNIFCYIDVRDFASYLEVAEELNLRILDIVAEAGTGLALPGQMLRVEGTPGRLETDSGTDRAPTTPS